MSLNSKIKNLDKRILKCMDDCDKLREDWDFEHGGDGGEDLANVYGYLYRAEDGLDSFIDFYIDDPQD